MVQGSLAFNSKPKQEHQLSIGSAMCNKKTCTSCGAVSTPQWREGPCGPRTLCNACGVKHLRHVRGHQRPESHSAAHNPIKKGAASRISKPQVCHGRSEAGSKHNKVSSASKQDILSRLWPINADDCSQPSSESAGGICWASAQPAACNQQDMLQMGTECAAAVNLLSMTRPQRSLQQYASIAPQNPILPRNSQVPGLHCDADAHMSDRQRSDSSQEEDAEQESEIALKLEHARSCAAVRFQVHMAKREAAAADAAVAAVTQVLEMKQDAARKAQAAVRKAERQIKQLTEEN